MINNKDNSPREEAKVELLPQLVIKEKSSGKVLVKKRG